MFLSSPEEEIGLLLKRRGVCFNYSNEQIVQDQVRDVSLVTPLAENYMVQHKSCRENQTTHFMFNNFFSQPVPFTR
jgi:hypothetical protein